MAQRLNIPGLKLKRCGGVMKCSCSRPSKPCPHLMVMELDRTLLCPGGSVPGEHSHAIIFRFPKNVRVPFLRDKRDTGITLLISSSLVKTRGINPSMYHYGARWTESAQGQRG
ncbi:Hypothetical predicted protein [Marmota monax]|uniref:Uncharacterized protein n=1 Tax=Marmota monax TaxID=9995 RepID=A0A5E4B9Q2_MARMO|nr:hypothetical protein GHT09_017447 [Marmota monax]VTJ65452.1 Hypothetical predicted protein [Marmota monax]